MAYWKRIYKGQDTMTQDKYHSYRCGGSGKRAPNHTPTTDQQKKINDRHSIRHLAELINTNFVENDIRLDLTYAGEEPTPEEANKRLNKFLKDMRRLYKNLGIPFKWILTTEHQGMSTKEGKEGQRVRIHHHLLINSGDEKVKFSDIKALWPYSKLKYNSMRYFDGTWESACSLAAYFTKETSKTMRKPGTLQRARYRASRNLTPPNVKVEVIHSKTWTDHPKPPRGYIIQEVREGFTEEGYPYQHIVMVKAPEAMTKSRASPSNKGHQKATKREQRKARKKMARQARRKNRKK